MPTCMGLVDLGKKTPVCPVCTSIWGQRCDSEMDRYSSLTLMWRDRLEDRTVLANRAGRSALRGLESGYHIWGLLCEPVTAHFSTDIPNLQINYLLT